MNQACSEVAILQPLDLSRLLSSTRMLDDLLTEPGVSVQYRPRWMVEGRDGFVLSRPGSNIAQLVSSLAARGHIAPEAAALGSVFLSDGGVVPREQWRSVRPKPDTVIFISIVPAGGDNLFAQIAGLAVAALAIAVSRGALATLAPALFGVTGEGTGIGAQHTCDVRSVAHGIIDIARRRMNPALPQLRIGAVSQLTTLNKHERRAVIVTEILGRWPIPYATTAVPHADSA